MKFKLFGGSSAVTTFTDTFHRVDQPFGLGDQWALAPMLSPTTTLSGPSIAGSINVAGNQASFSIGSVNGNNNLMCYPIPITWDVVFGTSQFAQCRITADNSGGANFAFNGPGVLISPNKNTGYIIETNIIGGVGNSVGKYSVISLNGSGAVTTINNNGNAGFSYAINDLLRIEAVIGSSGTTVNTYKNGVQQSSNLDATNKYSFGVFGIMDIFVSAAVTQSWDNFQGGKL